MCLIGPIYVMRSEMCSLRSTQLSDPDLRRRSKGAVVTPGSRLDARRQQRYWWSDIGYAASGHGADEEC